MNWEKNLMEGIFLIFLGYGAWQDWRNQVLSCGFLTIFGGTGLMCNVLFRYQEAAELVSGIALGIVFLMIGHLTGEAIGYGDGWGIMITGIFKGGSETLLILTIAFLISGIWGIRKIRRMKSLKETFPFFPFLFLGSVGVMLL